MQYIVLDLEWNQADTPEESVSDIPFEIVEIGAVKLNNDRKMVSEFSELVKPQVYSKLHGITQKLIHLQMEQLMSGSPFQGVYSRFRQWCGDDIVFCTWGCQVLTELQRNIRHFGMDPISDGPISYLDVQKLFSIAFEDKKTRRNLEYAIDFLKLDKDIPFHRAFSDAYYTAEILSRIPEDILEFRSYDVFHLPKDREHEIHVRFSTYDKYISRSFDTKEELLEDNEVTSTKCCYCHKNIKRKMKWFTTNGRQFYCLSYCASHGYMKSKLRIRKSEDGRFYAVKTDRFIGPDEISVLRKMQVKSRKLQKSMSWEFLR